MNYILDEHNQPVPCDDIETWGQFMEDVDARRVDETQVGPARVSTVFLGLDHSRLRMLALRGGICGVRSVRRTLEN